MLKWLTKIFSGAKSDELGDALKSGALKVDVRSPSEYKQGSVPGAVNIPLNTIEKELKKFKGHDTIVVFCQSGARSGQARSILQRHGFKNVINGGSWHRVNNAVKDAS